MLEWDCAAGEAQPNPDVEPDPGGLGFDATNMLTVSTASTGESVKCTCSANGRSNCNTGILSVDVTIKVPGK